MKKCSMCKIEKPFTDFAKATSTKDNLQRGCKECKANQYRQNTGKYKQASREARERRVAKLNALKASPCVDCDVSYPPYVMQFDHIGSDKVAGVADLMHKSSWTAIEAEVAKCELVCANCHAERTYQRYKAEGKALAVFI